MRLLLVSDLHYRLRQLDWLVTAVADEVLAIDALVVAGDLLDIRSSVPLNAQMTAVTEQLRALSTRTRLLVASGNHDLNGRDAAREKAATWLSRAALPGVHIDGDSVVVSQTLFTVCPWWDGPVGKQQLADRLARDADVVRQRWVWIYHAPPAGSPLSWDGRRDYGDEVLTEWLELFRPDIVLTGHIHQAPFVDAGDWHHRIGPTWLFNAGHQPGPVPTHIVVDLGAGIAEWRSATEHRTARLNLA